MQPVSLFHDDVLSGNHRDTNRKTKQKCKIENHTNWPGVNKRDFWLPFIEITTSLETSSKTLI